MALIIGVVGNFIANRMKEEALALDSDESRQIAESAAEVARHYNVNVDPKVAAWIALAGTVGSIYGAKIAAIRINREISSNAN